MGAKYFIADHYQWLAGIIILLITLTVLALKNYFIVVALLKAQMAENRKLIAQVSEYETDHTDALAHLNAANERRLKSQHFAHTSMKDEQRLKHNQTMEVMAKGHLRELIKLKAEHAKELSEIKAAHKKTVEGLKGGYTYAIENQQTEYTKVSEELKEQYQVAIEERQYQFESKRVQYETFFRSLDQFDNDNEVRIGQSMYTVLNDFERNFIQAGKHGNKKNADNAVRVASKRLQKLALDANQKMAKIKEEINTIRLIANMAFLQKLDELAEVYDYYIQAFNKLMNEFIPLLLASKTDKILENEHYLYEAANAIPAIKEALINLTRVEVRAA